MELCFPFLWSKGRKFILNFILRMLFEPFKRLNRSILPIHKIGFENPQFGHFLFNKFIKKFIANMVTQCRYAYIDKPNTTIS